MVINILFESLKGVYNLFKKPRQVNEKGYVLLNYYGLQRFFKSKGSEISPREVFFYEWSFIS